MRLISFVENGKPHLAAITSAGMVRLDGLVTDSSMGLDAVLQRGPDALADLARTVSRAASEPFPGLDAMTLLPPVQRPGKIICLGLNYADHAAEGGHTRPDYPSVFMRGATSLVAHGQPMILPQCSEKFDYEAELAVIISRRCRHVPVEQASQVIAGYSCFNDGSIRDYQKRTSQWTVGKNFDATGAFGPAFVTPDELPAGARGLRVQTRLNGTVMQDANTSDMLLPVDEAISILSECMTLEPGDVIVTGTPAGVGAARKPPVWLRPGDRVEVEIEGVGLLCNEVREEIRQG